MIQDAATMGLRERKKRETVHRIQEAALELSLRHGYEATRAEDIAAAADVSPRTLFRYFATKEDIFRDDDDSILDELRETMVAFAPQKDLLGALRAYAQIAADRHVARREFFVRRHQLLMSTPQLARHASAYRSQFVDALSNLVSEHAGLDVQTLRIAMGALEGAINAARQVWLDADGKPSLHALWSDVMDLLEPVLRRAFAASR